MFRYAAAGSAVVDLQLGYSWITRSYFGLKII